MSWPLQGRPKTQPAADCPKGRGHLDWKRGEVEPRLQSRWKPSLEPSWQTMLGPRRQQPADPTLPFANLHARVSQRCSWPVPCTELRQRCTKHGAAALSSGAQKPAQSSKEACGDEAAHNQHLGRASSTISSPDHSLGLSGAHCGYGFNRD